MIQNCIQSLTQSTHDLKVPQIINRNLDVIYGGISQVIEAFYSIGPWA